MSEKKRPDIPAYIRMALFSKAAGRCEFEGCNKILYEDYLTKKRINNSNIAHIISWTPDGPRGDKELSRKLATNIDNLMLTCIEHNRLIDENEEIYTVDILREMKKNHEDRVRYMTSIGQDRGIRVIRIIQKIQDQNSFISEQDISESLFPLFRKGEIIDIDLSSTLDIESAKKIIAKKIDIHINNNESFAVFCMSTIPVACVFGYELGNKIKYQLYQYHRNEKTWKWFDNSQLNNGSSNIIVEYPEIEGIHNAVNLVIELSGLIDDGLLPDNPTYRISTNKPGRNWLMCSEQITEFLDNYRMVMDEIRHKNGEDVVIHLFVAVPNPISIEIGSNIQKNLDPTVVLYDKSSQTTHYEKICILHKRIRE